MSASGSASPPTDRRRRRVPIKRKKLRDDDDDDEEMELEDENAPSADGDEEEEELASVRSDEDDEEDEEDEEEGAWGSEDSSADEDEVEVPVRAICIFCRQDEEHDPSEEYETPIECAVCGSNAHRQCARTEAAKALERKRTSENNDENNATEIGTEDAATALEEVIESGEWRCPTCEENGAQPDPGSPVARSRSSKRTSRAATDASDTEIVDASYDAIEAEPEEEEEEEEEEDEEEEQGGEAEESIDVDIIENRESKTSSNRRQPGGRKRKSDEIDEDLLDLVPKRKKRVYQRRAPTSRTNRSALLDENGVALYGYTRTGRPRGRPRPKKDSTRESNNNNTGLNVHIKQTTRRCMLHITGLNPGKLQTVIEGEGRGLKIGEIAGSEATLISRPSRRTTYTPRISANPRATPGRNVHLPPPPYPQFTMFPPPVENEADQKPYGGILNETDADTTKTLPGPHDRLRFEKARTEAEAESNTHTNLVNASIAGLNTTNGTAVNNSVEPSEHGSNKPEAGKESSTASKIKCIHFGGFEIDTWYAAPYPEEYSKNRILYICEFCLKYMGSEYVSNRHKMKCPWKHPPGDEIYRDGSISVFEVDGRKNSIYCQNLCLLAKLFLGSKTLYYDVEPFLFYVMTEYDELGCHFVGYFSKEKRTNGEHNVSCILTLPIHQRKGYGNLLIDFSYLLTRTEQKTGSPEKPLSDLGLVSYRNYWRLVLCYALRHQKTPISVEEISDKTGMTPDDIICGLEGLKAIVRDAKTGMYAMRLDYELFEYTIQKWEAKRYVRLNPQGLVWTPFIQGRGESDAPALATVAPREGEEKDEERGAEEVAKGKAEETKPDVKTAPSTDGTVTTTVPLKDADGDSKMEDEPIGQESPSVIKPNEEDTPTANPEDSNEHKDLAVTTPVKRRHVIKLGHPVDQPPDELPNTIPDAIAPAADSETIRAGTENLSLNDDSQASVTGKADISENLPIAESHESRKSTSDVAEHHPDPDPSVYEIPANRFEEYPPPPGKYPRRGGRGGGGFGSGIPRTPRPTAPRKNAGSTGRRGGGRRGGSRPAVKRSASGRNKRVIISDDDEEEEDESASEAIVSEEDDEDSEVEIEEEEDDASEAEIDEDEEDEDEDEADELGTPTPASGRGRSVGKTPRAALRTNGRGKLKGSGRTSGRGNSKAGADKTPRKLTRGAGHGKGMAAMAAKAPRSRAAVAKTPRTGVRVDNM